jgi:hypothetical protein
VLPAPRLVSLAGAQRQEAVALLAELLLGAARTGGVRFDGGSPGVWTALSTASAYFQMSASERAGRRDEPASRTPTRSENHQIRNRCTAGQLQLLFFSSRRRAQDRLLFLYRNRIVDRFYPAAPFGSGKPEAHWLLDEAGALLVAAMLGLERKQLGWQRCDDWGSQPQLAHQLEVNRSLSD